MDPLTGTLNPNSGKPRLGDGPLSNFVARRQGAGGFRVWGFRGLGFRGLGFKFRGLGFRGLGV